MRRALGLGVLLLLGACGEEEKDRPQLPDLIDIFPADGATGVSIATRVQATIDRADADRCRFVMNETTVVVRQGGAPVAGALVYFIDGLRVDFTPTGLFDFDRAYTVEVETSCAAPADATFSTLGEPAGAPTVAPGDAFRIENLAISEPQAIAPILRGFLADAELVLKVMDYAEGRIDLLGAEGRQVSDPLAPDPELRVFKENAFLFPMTGTFKWPYFQSIGSLGIPVDIGGGQESTIDLENFEISGQLFGTSPATEIVGGVIRASSPCDQVCAVQDQDLQLVCGNRSSICDAAGMLNLVGSFEGPSNDLRGYQQLTARAPDADATGVDVGVTLSATFSRAVNTARTRPVIWELRDASGALVAGETTVAGDGLSSTFAPTAPLAAGAVYDVLLIAYDAIAWQFTTAP